MKTFFGLFTTCFVFCVVAAYIVLGFLASNFWAIIIAVAFVLAIITTILAKLVIRIEELEKRIQQLQDGQESPPPEEKF